MGTVVFCLEYPQVLDSLSMSTTEEIEVPPLPPPIPQAPRPPKKLKPARKQVKPGDVNKTETVQTGKEYSEPFSCFHTYFSLVTFSSK